MKKYLRFLSVCFSICCFNIVASQELYIGSEGKFHLKNNVDFTTSNTVVTVENQGVFSVEANSQWGNEDEYVDGRVIARGTGTTKLPTGTNGIYAPVIAEHQGRVAAKYFNRAPRERYVSPLIHAVADTEFWRLNGKAVITLPWNEHSNMGEFIDNNGGDLDALTIVGLRNNRYWGLTSLPTTSVVEGDEYIGTVTSDSNRKVRLKDFTQFTFGVDRIKLITNILDLSSRIEILSNPISKSENIRFKTDNLFDTYDISIYDMSGRNVGNFNNIKTLDGIGEINSHRLSTGIYIVKFNHQGKQGTKKIIIQ